MKYVVAKENLLTKVFAIVGRDGVVVWNPQRNKASELSKEKAVAIANRFRGAEAVCADCGGNCDHMLEVLKAAVC